MTIFSHEHVHWLFAVFFAGVAVYIAVNGRYALNARCAWAGLRVAAGDGSSDDQRIEAAVKRRQAAEGPPAPIGLFLSGIFMLLALAAAFNVSRMMLFFVLAICVGTPIITVLTFSRLRNLQPIRAALLAVRTSNSVIPTYWFVVAATCALLVLSFANVPGYALPSVIVCISSLMTVLMAWRMTLLPAMISGEDVPAEQLVDDRLRFNRSTVCMFYALLETWMFDNLVRSTTALQAIAFYVSLVSVVAFWLWITLWRYRAVRLA